MSRGSEETALPRQVVYLPEARAPAAEGGIPPLRSAGADEPVVCHSQDCWHQIMRGLSPAAWMRIYQRNAHQHVWSERQLRSTLVPRAPRIDPQVSRGEASLVARSRLLGHRHAAPRVSLCG